jgi:MYXO-CTERM domain-containing protein
MRPSRLVLLATLGLGLATPAHRADAFCGFYVGHEGDKLLNDATMVVMMRDGTRTVLSMANDYQGPLSDFAMVVPVPVVLQKEQVKTLPREVFDAVDKLASPRLVEYWEQDPCAPRVYEEGKGAVYPAAVEAAGAGPKGGLGVRVEARFSVGEYDIVILSASDSMGLDTWLRQSGYAIPKGAEGVLRPYVQSGMKFFVAKVDAKKVARKNGRATLSPLRFHYDAETFSLPVRLGLLSSGGTQDLVVHILARGKRYEVSNYPNVAIPTNYDVSDATRHHFGAFYASVFDRTLSIHPRAVVTEYAWDASSCDPCPVPALEDQSLATLGADVIPSQAPAGSFVLTRLHARYTKDSLGQDLIFREAPPIEGGRETSDRGGQKHGVSTSSVNNFQARYAIRHPWVGPIACQSPVRGVWGGPPSGTPGGSATPALDVAHAPRDQVDLVSAFQERVPELDITPPVAARDLVKPGARGCGSCGVPATTPRSLPPLLASLLALVGLGLRRRRR